MSSPPLRPADGADATALAPHLLAAAPDPPPALPYVLVRVDDGPLRRWVLGTDPHEAPVHETDAPPNPAA